MSHRRPDQRVHRLFDVVVGGLIGAVVGAIVAVNVVIYSGAERGYETPLPEVFSSSPFAGALAVLALITGPIAGALLARRRRRRRRH